MTQPGRQFDREPPYSLQDEMCLLGSMILAPACIPDVERVIRTPEAFYADAHAMIYAAAIKAADRKNGALDIVLLRGALTDRALLDAVGGDAYLEQLAQSVPNASNADYYARAVWSKYRVRRMIQVCGDYAHQAYTTGDLDGDGTAALLDRFESAVFEIVHESQTSPHASLAELLMEQYLTLDDDAPAERPVATGFADLDHKLGGGFHPGELIVIGARPSMGKTAIATSIIEQAAMGTVGPFHLQPSPVRQPIAVGFVSLEMRRQAIASRFLSAMSGVDAERIRARRISKSPEDEYAAIYRAASAIGQAAVYVDDSSESSITSIRARARRMVQREKIGLLVVDYMQLVTAPGSARESRQVEVSAISRGLKLLGQELNIPVVVLVQLNREVENRASNRPRMSDIRESGAVEQDADVVMLLHREAYYHGGDPAWTPGPAFDEDNAARMRHAELIIAKQRNGPTGSVDLYWDPATTRFRNWSGDKTWEARQ